MSAATESPHNTLVIIGNGMASNRLLEQLGEDHPFEQILVLSNEAVPHYNRIMLSPLLAGDTQLSQITPHDEHWYQQRRIRILLNHSVTRLDVAQRQLECGQRRIGFSQLVIATGSQPSIPHLPHADAHNVSGFRDIRDVERMLEQLPQLSHVCVIGAGLLGVEAAVGLRSQGVDVSLLHRNPVLMNRQLDASAAGLLHQSLQQRGIAVHSGISQIELQAREQRVSAVSWNTASSAQPQQQPTELVIFTTGVSPLIRLAGQQLACDRGILVDQYMRTSVNGIYALGECCQFEQHTYGLVAPIWDQAEVLAQQLIQPARQHDLQVYREQSHLTKLKVSGLDVHSLGRVEASAGEETLSYFDEQAMVYKKIILRNNRISGALCLGDVRDSQWYFELMRNQDCVKQLRDQLLFGRAACVA